MKLPRGVKLKAKPERTKLKRTKLAAAVTAGTIVGAAGLAVAQATGLVRKARELAAVKLAPRE